MPTTTQAPSPPPRFTLRALGVCACLATAGLGAVLAAWPYWRPARAPVARPARDFDFSERALQQRLAGFDPAMAALARRFDGAGVPLLVSDAHLPAPPFASDDLAPMTPAQAVRANAAVPIDSRYDRPASPFSLAGMSAQGADQALDCLTAAVYYEAAYEAPIGQAAVAQVVLNRVRHPAFPKTVCGVVLQGSDRKTGCQFTFTCDGALARAPNPAVWLQARSVASAALAGKVEKTVGHATHYHTIWVRPYWAPTLTKVRVIGAHIFYRWAGGWGLAGAFNGRYLGEGASTVGMAALYKALHKPLLPDAAVGDPGDPLLIAASSPPAPPSASAPAALISGAAAPTAPSVTLVSGSAPPPPPPSEKITVLGEVEKPGEYPWREGLTVEEAVALAGGYTYRAKKSTVLLQKGGQLEAAKHPAQPLTLSPGDRVKIPERFF